jgi:hypothetical protein
MHAKSVCLVCLSGPESGRRLSAGGILLESPRSQLTSKRLSSKVKNWGSEKFLFWGLDRNSFQNLLIHFSTVIYDTYFAHCWDLVSLPLYFLVHLFIIYCKNALVGSEVIHLRILTREFVVRAYLEKHNSTTKKINNFQYNFLRAGHLSKFQVQELAGLMACEWKGIRDERHCTLTMKTTQASPYFGRGRSVMIQNWLTLVICSFSVQPPSDPVYLL